MSEQKLTEQSKVEEVSEEEICDNAPNTKECMKRMIEAFSDCD